MTPLEQHARQFVEDIVKETFQAFEDMYELNSREVTLEILQSIADTKDQFTKGLIMYVMENTEWKNRIKQ